MSNREGHFKLDSNLFVEKGWGVTLVYKVADARCRRANLCPASDLRPLQGAKDIFCQPYGLWQTMVVMHPSKSYFSPDFLVYSKHWSFERANNSRLFTRFIGTTICTWGFFITSKYPPLTGKNETGMSALPQKHPQKTFSPNPGSMNSIQPTWVCVKISPNLVFNHVSSHFKGHFLGSKSCRILFDGGELSEPLMQRQLFLEWLTDFHHNEYVLGGSVLLKPAAPVDGICWRVFTQKTHSQHPKKSPKHMCRWFLWVSC